MVPTPHAMVTGKKTVFSLIFKKSPACRGRQDINVRLIFLQGLVLYHDSVETRLSSGPKLASEEIR